LTSEPVAWGVLGVADIAVRKVIPAIQASRLGRVEAIASRNKSRAEEAASRLGIAEAYGSYEELLGSPDVEAVYIPLPNHLHAQWTIAAAEAGKHVLCEKPLAMTAAEAGPMIQACDAAGVKLMEAFMYRLHPLWEEARKTITRGDIGEVRAIQTVFSYYNDDPENIRNIPTAGGGALYDVGCYAVSVARMIFGSEPTGVSALVRRDDGLGTDVVTSALLDFDGRHATFVCSTQLEPDQRVEILGTTGRLVIEIPFNIPPDRPTRLLKIAGGDPPVSPSVEVIEVPTANPYTVQADAFVEAIRSDGAVPIPTEDSVANLEAIEAIFAAAGVPA
jgi:predicted dehydrogenase